MTPENDETRLNCLFADVDRLSQRLTRAVGLLDLLDSRTTSLYTEQHALHVRMLDLEAAIATSTAARIQLHRRIFRLEAIVPKPPPPPTP